VSILGTVRSLIASHRAKRSHPDRKIFIPQSRRLPCAGHFSRRLAQLRSTVPNSPTAVPSFPATVPISPATLPRECPPIPTGEKIVPNEPAAVPNFSASLPIFPRVFPNFRTTFPNFSPADIISNGLFPSYLSQNTVGTARCSVRARKAGATILTRRLASQPVPAALPPGSSQRDDPTTTFFPQLPTANSQLLKKL
jgi:hypothetical protein